MTRINKQLKKEMSRRPAKSVSALLSLVARRVEFQPAEQSGYMQVGAG